jgi:DNA-binding LacI/PurR family transcriptional regulator
MHTCALTSNFKVGPLDCQASMRRLARISPLKDDRGVPKKRRNPQGSQEVTLRDIAVSLGLSHTTVSRALHDHPHISQKTKAQIRQAAEKLGYVPNSAARSMRSGYSRTVGLIVPDIENEFYSAAARSLAELCGAEGFQLLLAVSRDDPREEERQIQALREARVAGVLICATAKPTLDTIQMLGQLRNVQFLRVYTAISGPSVTVDDVGGLMKVTTHLIELGHKRIGYVGVSEELSTGKGRATGFRQAFKAKKWMPDAALMRFGPATPHFGHAAVYELLGRTDRPSALVIGSPRIMLGALEAAEAHHMEIPSDLSIVAYSDSDWLRVWRPPITAVALPLNQMAAAAAELLFQRIAHSTQSQTTEALTFESVLQVRASTASPAKVSAIRSR